MEFCALKVEETTICDVDVRTRVVEAIESSRIAAAEWVDGAWVEPLDELVVIRLGFSEFWANVALALRPLKDPAGSIERAAKRLAPHAMSVQVVAEATPQTEHAAIARGMSAREEFFGLVRDPAGLDIAPPRGFSIEVVTDQAALDAYVVAQSEGFGDDRAMNAARHPLRMLGDERVRLLNARESGGSVAATARVFIDAGTVSVHGVTTLPSHRGKGIASALVSEAMRLGIEAGADLAWLSAGDDVAPLYENLGFTRVVRLRMYAPVL